MKGQKSVTFAKIVQNNYTNNKTCWKVEEHCDYIGK